ncbi:hypothetical protein DHEL01_v205249 [Diaporthe helianthi]|uniref:Uncharacterized protein n=1 Tax=Diaporthe helianthi TaxID=158607 RepID=A0A2P5I1G4_DIAHE|nr:hypothetical protein DHEL01_v205249 [Diaporthe helianthi]
MTSDVMPYSGDEHTARFLTADGETANICPRHTLARLSLPERTSRPICRPSGPCYSHASIQTRRPSNGTCYPFVILLPGSVDDGRYKVEKAATIVQLFTIPSASHAHLRRRGGEAAVAAVLSALRAEGFATDVLGLRVITLDT